jgi:hypothetical protein
MDSERRRQRLQVLITALKFSSPTKNRKEGSNNDQTQDRFILHSSSIHLMGRSSHACFGIFVPIGAIDLMDCYVRNIS